MFNTFALSKHSTKSPQTSLRLYLRRDRHVQSYSIASLARHSSRYTMVATLWSLHQRTIRRFREAESQRRELNENTIASARHNEHAGDSGH